MATLYTHQSKNIWKTWLLMTLFFVVVIAIGYVFAEAYNSPGILYFAIIFSVFMNVFSYWFSDKIVLSMYRATPVTNESHPDLYNVVENMAITAGLPMPKVYVIPDPAPNAFATGRNKHHAAVAVTSGLLQILNKTELEGVIAHELSHVGNRDTLISTIVVVLVGFVALLSNMFMRGAMFGGVGRRDDRGGNVFAILGLVLAIFAPVSVTLIQLAISRKREYLADVSGALLTRYPEGLASALEKISHFSRPMARANKATAHLFIANPFGGTGKKLTTLFMSHPPAEDRIRILRGMH
jgi:heat shock protein HtpX